MSKSVEKQPDKKQAKQKVDPMDELEPMEKLTLELKDGMYHGDKKQAALKAVASKVRANDWMGVFLNDFNDTQKREICMSIANDILPALIAYFIDPEKLTVIEIPKIYNQIYWAGYKEGAEKQLAHTKKQLEKKNV